MSAVSPELRRLLRIVLAAVAGLIAGVALGVAAVVVAMQLAPPEATRPGADRWLMWVFLGGFLAGLVAMGLYDAAGARNRGLQVAALTVPFLAGIALAVLGVANYPLGSGLTCVGA